MGTEGQGVTAFQGTALYAKPVSKPLKNSQTYQGEMQSLGQAERFMAKLGLVDVTVDTDCQVERSKNHFGVTSPSRGLGFQTAQKGESEHAPALSSLLPDCRCDVTSHLKFLSPCLS